MVHLMHHNYFKLFRTRSEDPGLTHAQQAGLDRERIFQLRGRSFRDRAFGWRLALSDWQVDLWKRRTSVPVHPVTPLARHLLTA